MDLKNDAWGCFIFWHVYDAPVLSVLGAVLTVCPVLAPPAPTGSGAVVPPVAAVAVGAALLGAVRVLLRVLFSNGVLWRNAQKKYKEK